MEANPREQLRRLLNPELVTSYSQPAYDEPRNLAQADQEGDIYIHRSNIDPEQFNGMLQFLRK